MIARKPGATKGVCPNHLDLVVAAVACFVHSGFHLKHQPDRCFCHSKTCFFLLQHAFKPLINWKNNISTAFWLLHSAGLSHYPSCKDSKDLELAYPSKGTIIQKGDSSWVGELCFFLSHWRFNCSDLTASSIFPLLIWCCLSNQDWLLTTEVTDQPHSSASRTVAKKRRHWHAEIWATPQGGSAWQSLCFCCNCPMHQLETISTLCHAPCLPISRLSFATFCCQYFLTLCPEKNQKIFSHYSKGNKGQPMPCQDPTYLSMPWRGTWDREDPKKLYTTPNHDPWNIQPKACALKMLEWCEEVSIGTIACKGFNTNAYHLTPPSVQGKLAN